jgi:circadian clock protein KaiB
MNIILRLYVAGRSASSQRAIANLRRLCETDFEGVSYDLEVIDVLEHPQLAENEKILATPTLIRELPPPLRRLVGDLSDREKVLLGLDILPRAPAPREKSDA